MEHTSKRFFVGEQVYWTINNRGKTYRRYGVVALVIPAKKRITDEMLGELKYTHIKAYSANLSQIETYLVAVGTPNLKLMLYKPKPSKMTRSGREA